MFMLYLNILCYLALILPDFEAIFLVAVQKLTLDTCIYQSHLIICCADYASRRHFDYALGGSLVCVLDDESTIRLRAISVLWSRFELWLLK